MRTTSVIISGLLLSTWSLCVPTARAADQPDAWITTKVKMSLLTDGAVPGMAINVDTVGGRVILHGTVATENEKAKAETVAKGIEGVHEVQNLLAVVPRAQQEQVEANDEVLRKRIQASLNADRSLEDSDITIQSVNGGVVYLSGKATGLSDQLRAMEHAMAETGTRRVVSDIQGPQTIPDDEFQLDLQKGSADARSTLDEVGQGIRDAGRETGEAIKGAGRAIGEAGKQTGEKIKETGKEMKEAAGDVPANTASAASDAWITTKTKSRFLLNGDVPALDINVDTRNGVVTLFGIVPDELAKQAAEAEARKVSGVQHVRNQLQIVPDSKREIVDRNDSEVQTDINRQLEALKGQDIDVEVNNGVVRLNGSVSTHSNHFEALRIARSTQGVRSIVDNLQVERD